MVTPNEPVWQRNYYEHIVRGQHDLKPIRWSFAKTSPAGIATEIGRCAIDSPSVSRETTPPAACAVNKKCQEQIDRKMTLQIASDRDISAKAWS
jgi:hypothetical protein